MHPDSVDESERSRTFWDVLQIHARATTEHISILLASATNLWAMIVVAVAMM
jgi:hypothetical protein